MYVLDTPCSLNISCPYWGYGCSFPPWFTAAPPVVLHNIKYLNKISRVGTPHYGHSNGTGQVTQPQIAQ